MSTADFYREGCVITRHNIEGSVDTGLRRFREHFYATPIVCSILWNMMTEKQMHPNGATVKCMLCALLFLKCYNTETVNSGTMNLDEKTVRKWQWIYIDLIAGLRLVCILYVAMSCVVSLRNEIC